MVAVARRTGEAAVAPTVENAMSGTYPITRPLLIYTVGEPMGEVGTYLAWILSSDGQELVRRLGYVPVQ
jgi:phosphate transport system substrate-binding protein